MGRSWVRKAHGSRQHRAIVIRFKPVEYFRHIQKRRTTDYTNFTDGRKLGTEIRRNAFIDRLPTQHASPFQLRILEINEKRQVGIGDV